MEGDGVGVGGIGWEREEDVSFMDKVLEGMKYGGIGGSREVGKEKGGYDYFEGREWERGGYFIKGG